MIAHILLLPHPEHRERLLADGPCGARPPQFTRWPGHRWLPGDLATHPDGQTKRALALAYDGAVCPEGVDRLGRTLRRATRNPVEQRVSRVLWRQRFVSELADYVARLGTIVLLDADGKVSDV